MTNEELVGLIQTGTDISRNLGLLYEQNRNFIYKVALPYSSTCEMDDLMQEAYFGIVEAAKRFQPDKEMHFLTYAEYWIKNKIHRYYENHGNLKRIPANVLTLISKYQKIKADYKVQNDGEPTDQEYCFYLGITQRRLESLRKYMIEANSTSLDSIVPGTEDMVLGDSIPDDFDLEGCVVEEAALEQGKRVLWKVVADLGDRPQAIIEGRYRANMSLEAVGFQQGISKERVRQLEIKAIRLLRKKREIAEAAMLLGYGSYVVYHWGVQRFKDTGTSSTEYLAIKNIEREEQQSDISNHLKEILQDADRKITQTNLKIDELNAEIEAFMRIRKRGSA